MRLCTLLLLLPIAGGFSPFLLAPSSHNFRPARPSHPPRSSPSWRPPPSFLLASPASPHPSPPSLPPSLLYPPPLPPSSTSPLLCSLRLSLDLASAQQALALRRPELLPGSLALSELVNADPELRARCARALHPGPAAGLRDDAGLDARLHVSSDDVRELLMRGDRAKDLLTRHNMVRGRPAATSPVILP